MKHCIIIIVSLGLLTPFTSRANTDPQQQLNAPGGDQRTSPNAPNNGQGRIDQTGKAPHGAGAILRPGETLNSPGTGTVLATPTPTAQDVQNRINGIFTEFKGTGDIAGVARSLFNFNEWHKRAFGVPYFTWTTPQEDAARMTKHPDPTLPRNTVNLNANDFEKFKLNTTSMMCYEFVHYCAFIASDQVTRPVYKEGAIGEKEAAEKGIEPSPAVLDPTKTSVPWGFGDKGIAVNTHPTSERTPPPGSIVTGSALGGFANNSGGYFHVVVAVGGGEVIGLGSDGLEKKSLGDTFGMFYGTVLFGDYNFGTSNGNSHPAPQNPSKSLTPANPPRPAPYNPPGTPPMG